MFGFAPTSTLEVSALPPAEGQIEDLVLATPAAVSIEAIPDDDIWTCQAKATTSWSCS